MIIATTNVLEGRPVMEYLGVVCGEAIFGANIMKEVFAGSSASSVAAQQLASASWRSLTSASCGNLNTRQRRPARTR